MRTDLLKWIGEALLNSETNLKPGSIDVNKCIPHKNSLM